MEKGGAQQLNYFKNIQKVNFHDLIYETEKVYAHVDTGLRKETLEEHSKLCIKYLEKIITKKKLKNVLLQLEDKIIGDVSNEGKQLYREMLYHTIFLHDIGKINCNFQYLKMKNKLFKDWYNIDCNNSNHSMLSAVIYINEFFSKIGKLSNNEDQKQLCILLLLNAYVISKHHGDFDSFDEFQKKLIESDGEGKRLYTEQTILFKDSYQKDILGKTSQERLSMIVKLVNSRLSELESLVPEISIDFYIYERFIASLLLSCDYYATSEFRNQTEITDFGEINDIQDFYEIFKQSKVYQSIMSYESKEYFKVKSYEYIKDINILRNELFLDAEKTLLNNQNRNIYYLEAPTGAGKSMVSFNLAFKMIEQSDHLNKIFYVYPFNTLIEQNLESLSRIFGNSEQMKNIAVINSLVPIKKMYKSKDNKEDSDLCSLENIDYDKSLLDKQFLHYPIVLTTHVSMFRFLFGTNKEDLFPLSQIANSVIIFDEIQSYKNSIWKEIITFLNHYSILLNIKVIIMSATLPNLSKLIDTEINAVSLIEDRNKYFQNSIFKERVKLDFSLLHVTDNLLDRIIEHVAKNGEKDNINILMEFIYRSSADEAYVKLCNLAIKNKEIMLLTGESSPYERKQIVKAFKERKNIILVSTQVIEAGVDLDANIGYKDISLLDSEEQFLGRINRHFLIEDEVGIVYFFNLNSAAELYRGDVRKETVYTLMNEEVRALLINKDFSTYYGKILEHLITRVNSPEGFNNLLKTGINTLDFKAVEKRMNLIDEQYQYSIFFSRVIEIDDSEFLDGEEVWDTYVSLLEDTKMDYSEKRIKLQEAAINLNHFVYKTRKADFPYEKHIGNLYYLSDIDKYFENGRFIRKNFDNDLFY